MNWQKSLKGKFRKNEALARHTSLRIGGPAQFWFEPRDLSDLQSLVNLAYKKKIPLRVIGAGSNILIDDRGIRGIVVRLNSPCFKRIILYRKQGIRRQIISAGAGLSLAKLIRRVQENALSGFELLAGIPGTAGGALIMNAGNIAERVFDVTVMDKHGRVKIVKRKDAQFSYRNSNLNQYIILSARFKLIREDKRVIKKTISQFLDYRRRTQDLSWPSAGCVFRNPHSKSAFRLRSGLMVSGEPTRLRSGFVLSLLKDEIEPSAAYFIERCGLKGSSIVDAAVSSKHANFIINKGRASFFDISRLMLYITRCVKKRFNLDLEPEIKIWRKTRS